MKYLEINLTKEVKKRLTWGWDGGYTSVMKKIRENTKHEKILSAHRLED